MGIKSYVPTQQSPEHKRRKNKKILLTNQTKIRYDNSIIVVYAGKDMYDNEEW